MATDTWVIRRLPAKAEEGQGTGEEYPAEDAPVQLLRRFARDKKHVYFVADLGVERDLLRSFSERTISSLGKEGLEGVAFPTWDTAFNLGPTKTA